MGKHMDDERYRQIRKDVAKIRVAVKYPCNGCKKHGIYDHCQCKDWKIWFGHAYRHVVNQLLEGTR